MLHSISINKAHRVFYIDKVTATSRTESNKCVKSQKLYVLFLNFKVFLIIYSNTVFKSCISFYFPGKISKIKTKAQKHSLDLIREF